MYKAEPPVIFADSVVHERRHAQSVDAAVDTAVVPPIEEEARSRPRRTVPAATEGVGRLATPQDSTIAAQDAFGADEPIAAESCAQEVKAVHNLMPIAIRFVESVGMATPNGKQHVSVP